MYKMRKRFTFSLFFIFSLISNVFSQVNKPIVQNISAKLLDTNKIEITWSIPEKFNATNLFIYRNVKPFSTVEQLYQLKPIAKLTPNSNVYVDNVSNFRTYYYLVLASISKDELYDIILPSVNATIKGVKITKQNEKSDSNNILLEKNYAPGVMRELPLPYLGNISDLTKKPNKLNKNVIEAGKSLELKTRQTKNKKLSPYYFEEDLVTPLGGDDYFLFEILSNSFIKENYANSITEFQDFLSVNRSESTTNRAVFYLGQALYYSENYRHAISMFLFVEEVYPALSRKWINSSLDLYKIQN